jgi:hypothetical protein
MSVKKFTAYYANRSFITMPIIASMTTHFNADNTFTRHVNIMF